MTRTLTAHEQPLSKIFSDDYVFSIPKLVLKVKGCDKCANSAAKCSADRPIP